MRWLGFFYIFFIVTGFINCLLILIRIYVLAIVGSDTFVFLALYSCISHFGYIKSYSVYIFTDFCISCFVPSPCVLGVFHQLNNWTIELPFVGKLNHYLSPLC